jgi:hypothetical protein
MKVWMRRTRSRRRMRRGKSKERTWLCGGECIHDELMNGNLFVGINVCENGDQF